MKDKLLHLFGLMTMTQARQIQIESTKLYARAIAEYAKNDFGIAPAITLETEATKWANDCFDQMVAEWRPGAALVGQWEVEAGE